MKTTTNEKMIKELPRDKQAHTSCLRSFLSDNTSIQLKYLQWNGCWHPFCLLSCLLLLELKKVAAEEEEDPLLSAPMFLLFTTLVTPILIQGDSLLCFLPLCLRMARRSFIIPPGEPAMAASSLILLVKATALSYSVDVILFCNVLVLAQFCNLNVECNLWSIDFVVN